MWKKDLVSAEGPGPFTLRLMPLIQINPPFPHILLKPSASAERPQHTLAEVNRLVKSQSEHCLSLTHTALLTHCSSHTFNQGQ